MVKRFKNLVVGLDIGSTKVACCLGTHEEGMTEILGYGFAPCFGLRRGIVVDIEETVSAISAALEDAERMSGFLIDNAFVGVGGAHITSENSKGVVAVSKADGEISEEDVKRAVEAARTVSLPPNREILHVVPKTFIIDGQEGIKDPIGMSGVRLEVEAHVIGVATGAIKNLTKCVYQSGITINELCFGPLALSKLLLSRKQKELGVILIDFGAGTTSMAVFEEGDLIHSAVLPIGSAHITNDVAIGLRTSLDVAEKLKKEHGYCDPSQVAEKESLDLSKIDKNEEGEVSKKYIAEIIEARISELFQLIKEELRKIDRDGMLPAGAVITGAGSKLHGLVDVVKEILKLPAQIGLPAIEFSGMVDKVDDPVYAQAVGLVLWGIEEGKSGYPKISVSSIGSLPKKIKEFFKQYLP
ncbi:MAG: cell division protein FtsA [Candidatus Berkelbacteria bacterium]|nr:cell division protein FtsA [Candidatus Berkelbacteria bacterium]